MSERPVGQRFSQVYLERQDLLPDSARMRRRLAALYVEVNHLTALESLMISELGVARYPNLRWGDYWAGYLEKIELRDLLDSVTLCYSTILGYDDRPDQRARQEFVNSVRRIFGEEGVRYSVDDRAGVHFAMDVEFERSRVSTVAALGGSRYNGVRELFDGAYAALDRTPPDGKAATRASFFAVESLFRLMFPSATKLSTAEIQRDLKLLIDTFYQGQKPAINVAQKQVAAFTDWVEGAHFYRHEPGSEEPAQPPLDIAILMLSQAAAYLRWLAGIDAIVQRGGAPKA